MISEQELFNSPPVETPKLFTRVFKISDDCISIVPLADFHVGSKNHMADLLKEYLAYIMSTPNCYAIGLGDYMENATRTSVGLGMYDEEYHFPRQYEKVEEMLRPLARAGKLIGMHGGNHERRTTLAVGMDPVYLLARSLDVPYLGYTAFHKWVVGKTVYKVITMHGYSNAKTAAGRLNALRNMRDIALADVYLMGHAHDRFVYKDMVYTINESTDSVEANYRYYIIAGGLLSWPGSYADMMAMPPVLTGLVKIDIYTGCKLVEVSY